MKQQIIAVPSGTAIGTFNAECSISGHRFTDGKTGLPLAFADESAVVMFGEKLLAKPLSGKLFLACSRALLKRYGAQVIHEDMSYAGIQKTFSLNTRYGPAEVVPLDSWIRFKFLDPENQSSSWGGTQGEKGQWHFIGPEEKLRDLLAQFADGLATCAIPDAAKFMQPQQASQILPPEVMKSGAGYYVGCYCMDDGFPSPHSRFSEYFTVKKTADEWLEKALADGAL
jgi:hypothetical protein